ncbi:MAG: hypothetical protein FJ098_17185 [Deltaproteobacteria bacterium]|nr:hypothetical protein [Deltaproteobacteria bacterium]
MAGSVVALVLLGARWRPVFEECRGRAVEPGTPDAERCGEAAVRTLEADLATLGRRTLAAGTQQALLADLEKLQQEALQVLNACDAVPPWGVEEWSMASKWLQGAMTLEIARVIRTAPLPSDAAGGEEVLTTYRQQLDGAATQMEGEIRAHWQGILADAKARNVENRWTRLIEERVETLPELPPPPPEPPREDNAEGESLDEDGFLQFLEEMSEEEE